MIVRFIDSLRDHLHTVVKLCWFVLALVVVIDAFIDKAHAHTHLGHLPGFWSVFGFIACSVLIIVSKIYGRLGISTREDYYE